MLKRNHICIYITGLLLALALGSCDDNSGGGDLNLEASQGTFTDKVQLDWDGISGATVYILEKNEIDDDFQDEIYNGTKTTADDNDVDPGVEYEYQVTAYGGGIDEVKSDKVTGYAAEE